MTAQPASPNWHWQQLGYTVERGQRRARTIRRQDGSEVVIPKTSDRHAAEIAAALDEYKRLPHGPQECRAAQGELPI